MRVIFLALATIIILASNAEATTWTLADCNQSTFDTKLADVLVISGDTIAIPAGTCSWTGRSDITKCIIVQGAGIGITTIQDAFAGDSSILSLTIPAACTTQRLTGISFSRNGGAYKNHGTVAVVGDSSTSRQMRIDHCAFDETLLGFHIVFQDAIGVLDNNIFTGSGIFIEMTHNNWGGVPFSNGSFADPPNYGSSRALFLEDNTFTHTVANYAIVDGYLGARFVTRYNTIINGWIEAHGSDSTPTGRGTRLMDIYYNKFICTITPCDYAANYRSGTGVIHDNTFYNYTGFFAVAAYRLANAFGPWGPADGYSFADLNDAGTPFETNTATGGTQGTSGANGTMTRTGAGWDTTANGGLGQWYGYSIRKTNCTNRYTTQCSSIIKSNTSDTITFEGWSYLSQLSIDFSGGGGYTIGKVTEAIDQPGRGQGTQLDFRSFVSSNSCTSVLTTATCTCATTCTGVGNIQTGDKIAVGDVQTEGRYNGTFTVGSTPSTTTFTFTTEASGLSNSDFGGVMKLPTTNDQVDEPLHEWNNCTDSQNPPRFGCGGVGGNPNIGPSPHPIQIRENEHYFNDTPLEGYSDYTYPHPLRGEEAGSGLISSRSRMRR